MGEDVAQAYARTERIEHAAHVLWLAHAIGRPTSLPENEARVLMEMYRNARNQPY